MKKKKKRKIEPTLRAWQSTSYDQCDVSHQFQTVS